MTDVIGAPHIPVGRRKCTGVLQYSPVTSRRLKLADSRGLRFFAKLTEPGTDTLPLRKRKEEETYTRAHQ